MADPQPGRGPSVHVLGLKEIQRSFREMDRGAAKDVRKGLRDAMTPVAAEASRLVPHRSGKLAASLRPFAVSSSVGIRSRVAYANVLHWGGTTGRGHRPGVGG